MCAHSSSVQEPAAASILFSPKCATVPLSYSVGRGGGAVRRVQYSQTSKVFRARALGKTLIALCKGKLPILNHALPLRLSVTPFPPPTGAAGQSRRLSEFQEAGETRGGRVARFSSAAISTTSWLRYFLAPCSYAARHRPGGLAGGKKNG